MQFTQIKETCLYVKDLEKTIGFYKDKIGLELFSYVKENHAFFRAGTSVLLCFNPEVSKNKTHIPRHFAVGEMHIALEVEIDDYKECKQKILAAEIEIEHEEKWSRGHLSFYFRDPDNHCIEIVQKGMWDS
ncbi:MAG: glyoxalase [Flavobacteriales bacterium]|nr:MAG: glyoxalase [Flavobacteriales bacterium]